MQTAEGATAIQFGGMAYARARGVDEALARLSEEFDGGKESSGLKARTYRKVVQWLAEMADRFNAKQTTAFLRGMTNTEAKAYVRSVFQRLSDDAPATNNDWAFTADPSFSRTAQQANPDIRFSCTDTSPPPVRGVPAKARMAMFNRLARGIASRWANAPRIVVATNMDDPAIPKSAREADAKQRYNGASGHVEGFWHEGTVYVLTDNLQSAADFVRVFLHESLGHHGLRGVFGPKLDAILSKLTSSPG